MPTPDELVDSIQASPERLSITDVLARYPGLARRAAQRWLKVLLATGRSMAIGEGRVRQSATNVNF